MMNELAELLPFLTARELAEIDKLSQGVEPPAWVPFDGPQSEALNSKADILFYGGAAGGGKTDLLLGAALTQHENAIIFRREFTQLEGIVKRSEEMYERFGKFNAQRYIWRFNRSPYLRHRVELGACQNAGSETKYQGRPHDLKGFDEITHFSEYQFRYLITWLRTTSRGRRWRVICTGNPPTDAEGDWVISYWAPWLDPSYPNPAKPGELRWFYTDADGYDKEAPDGSPVYIGEPDKEGNREQVYPMSRTFIKARIEDNPYLMATGYRRVLQGLPEPLRSRMLYGDFGVGKSDDVWQVIPTEWVVAAQKRWAPTYEEFLTKWATELEQRKQAANSETEPSPSPESSPESDKERQLDGDSEFLLPDRGPRGARLTNSQFDELFGVERPEGDVGLGRANVDISALYDRKEPKLLDDELPVDSKVQVNRLVKAFSQLKDAPLTVGADISRGGKADTVFAPRKGLWFAELKRMPGKDTVDGPTVIQALIECGFKDAEINMDVNGVGASPVDVGRMFGMKIHPMNGAEKSEATDRSGKLKMHNLRAEWWWKFREDLDPALGTGLALPPDPQLLRDLTAVRWKFTPRGEVLVEDKKDVMKRINRSPDAGDAVVNAHAKPSFSGEAYLDYWRQQAQIAENMRTDSRERSAA